MDVLVDDVTATFIFVQVITIVGVNKEFSITPLPIFMCQLAISWVGIIIRANDIAITPFYTTAVITYKQNNLLLYSYTELYKV